MKENMKNKKVTMVIAFQDFKDEEYFIPKKILEDAGVETKTVSNKIGQAIGSSGGDIQVDLLVENLNLSDVDATIFVGGPGCLECLDNQNSYDIIKKTISEDKILAAICISPVILAKAGVLKDKRATVWSSSLNRSAIRTLEENGVIYEDKSVIRDGKIITANGPTSAEEFGSVILETLAR